MHKNIKLENSSRELAHAEKRSLSGGGGMSEPRSGNGGTEPRGGGGKRESATVLCAIG